jgi:aminotransferase MxcL
VMHQGSSGETLAAYVLALPYDRPLSPERGHAIQALVRGAGALFVMDEMVTGFRLGHAGASEALGLAPDARCYGKALAAGMPLAALAVEARHAETMAALHVSTTYGGETLSLAAAAAAIEHYAAIDHYAVIDLPDRLAALGNALRDGLNARATALGLAPVLTGYPAIPWLTLAKDDTEHRRRTRLFQAAAARRGVLVAERSNFVNAAQDSALIWDVVERLGGALEEAVRQW